MLELDPSRMDLKIKIRNLEKEIEVKTEKMKTEMLGIF